MTPEWPAAGEHGAVQGGVGGVPEGAAEAEGGGGRGARQGRGPPQHPVHRDEERSGQVLTLLTPAYICGQESL